MLVEDKKMKLFYRHGDVVLHPTDKTEGTGQKHDGSFTLATGEATGHSHQILCEPKSMQVLKKGRNFVELQQEAELIHQQHKALKIQKGKYVQVQEREIDHFSGAVRRVVD